MYNKCSYYRLINDQLTDSNQKLDIKTFPHKLSDPFTMTVKFNSFHDCKCSYLKVQ